MWSRVGADILTFSRPSSIQKTGIRTAVKHIAEERQRYPTPQEFNEALQHPFTSLADEELRSCVVKSDVLGLPRPITGGFASVYEVQVENRKFGVRCFLRQSSQSEQYEIVADALKKLEHPSLVAFEYQKKGIRCGANWFPILKMDWAEGVTLDQYVEQNIFDSKKLNTLADRFLLLCKSLNKAGIAHGDLQHGNISVDANGNIKLVDYDSLIIQGKSSSVALELGHRNYQHPLRTAADNDLSADFFRA